MTAPIWPAHFVWREDYVMAPTDRFKSRCIDQYEVGQAYRLAHEEEASSQSRSHYFAVLRDIWMNLPDDLAKRFPDTEALRAWCLIREGYADQDIIDCKTSDEAIRTIALLGRLHPHSVFVRNDTTVQWLRAKSQSSRSMGGKVFQASKDAVLSRAASMIGVYDLAELAKPPKGRPEPPIEVEEADALEREPQKATRLFVLGPAPRPASERSPPQNGGNRPSSHVAPSRDWKAFPPRTPADYRTYLSDWVMALRDEGTILARWENEAPLRDTCGLSSADTDACRAMMERRILSRPSV